MYRCSPTAARLAVGGTLQVVQAVIEGGQRTPSEAHGTYEYIRV